MKRQTSPEPPITYGTDAEAMCNELDYEDMIALSGLYRQWALYESRFSPEQRTQLMAWSADLERLAQWAGEGWRAADPSPEMPMLTFLARWVRDRQVGKNAIAFDEETWAEAKPMFIEAAQEFRLATKDIGLLAGRLTRKLQDVYGLSVDAIEEMRPYLERFIREVRNGTIGIVAPEGKQAQQLPDRGE